MNLTELSQKVHLSNINWWRDLETGLPINRNKGELLALIHSEVSEAYDGAGLFDDKLPHRKMPEVELADAVIRIFDYIGGFGYDICQAGLKCKVSNFTDLNQFARRENAEYLPIFVDYSDIHSQISKTLELERKGKPSSEVAESLMALLLMIFHMADELGYDMQGAFDEKMTYNAKRTDHKHEHRKADGGKKF